jgi:hypothetical protein
MDFKEIRFFSILQRADNSSQKSYVRNGKLLFMYYSCKFGLRNFYRFWIKTIYVHLNN